MTARRSSRPKRPSKPLSTANRPPRWVGGFLRPESARVPPCGNARDPFGRAADRSHAHPSPAARKRARIARANSARIRKDPKAARRFAPFQPLLRGDRPCCSPFISARPKKSAAAAGQTAAAIACVESGSSAARACAGVESRRGAGGRARAADRRESAAWR